MCIAFLESTYRAVTNLGFGFGSTMLVERGWSLASAGSVTSLVLWIVSVSSPMAGFLADRTGKHKEVMLGGFALFAIVLLTANRTEAVIPVFVALGLASTFEAGSSYSQGQCALSRAQRPVTGNCFDDGR